MDSLYTFAVALGANIPKVEANQGTIDTVLNAVYGILGALAVIFIVVGGIRYTLAAGDSSKVAQAKNTILYAIVGLVIAVLAFAITNFILGSVKITSFNDLRDSVINTLLYIAGGISVIVIVIGALRYVTSGGESSKVAQAKNTILGAVIGLVITILAFAIVNFVLAALK